MLGGRCVLFFPSSAVTLIARLWSVPLGLWQLQLRLRWLSQRLSKPEEQQKVFQAGNEALLISAPCGLKGVGTVLLPLVHYKVSLEGHWRGEGMTLATKI